MPSEPQLAEILSIARSTVRQGMSELQRDGLVRRVQGTGTFVHEDAERRMRSGQDIFGLVVIDVFRGYHPELLRGLEAAARKVHHQTVVCCTAGDLDRQCAGLVQLLDKDVGGVALVPDSRTPTPAYHVRQLRERGIPVVYCHRPVDGVEAPLLALPFEKVGPRAPERFDFPVRPRGGSRLPATPGVGLQGAARNLPAELRRDAS